ncbi:hypothetical protein CS006_06900 [Bifidobacterium primatium]|uniref:Uncharacterized protein n=1 Tax=Bifidobacterium primatium TaxID=2045438 RepID=A0A2M9H838_9BIFI|nr:hypothetical protein [Bifidobacterium primatium]PJM72975.1 hypothetical protein CS006_06900 [Bifidobacterium primatium]
MTTMRDDGSRSEWYGMSADQVWAVYAARTRRIRAGHIAILLMVAVVYYVLMASMESAGLFYLTIVMFVIVTWLITVSCRRCLARAFAALAPIVVQDCDVDKYRAVLDRYAQHDRFNRSADRLAIEYARCDYLDDEPRRAVDRLGALQVSGDGNLRVMMLNIGAIACHMMGDYRRRDIAVEQLRGIVSRRRAGSAERMMLEGLLHDMGIWFRPASSWTRADADYIARRMEEEPSHHGRVGWQIQLAEYKVLHGDAEHARTLLEDPTLRPMVPRSLHEGDRVWQLMMGRQR